MSETTPGPELSKRIRAAVHEAHQSHPETGYCGPCAIRITAALDVVRPEVDQRDEEIERLTYERRLLYIARIVLDRVSVTNTFEQARDEAGDVAQRIVDEIGHSVTEEPALGPTFRVEIDQLKATIARVRAIHYPKTATQITPCADHRFPSRAELDCSNCERTPITVCSNLTCCEWPCQTIIALDQPADSKER